MSNQHVQTVSGPFINDDNQRVVRAMINFTTLSRFSTSGPHNSIIVDLPAEKVHQKFFPNITCLANTHLLLYHPKVLETTDGSKQYTEADMKKKFGRCPICRVSFWKNTDDRHRPLIIGCNHIYCHACIWRTLTQENRQTRCPTCRFEFMTAEIMLVKGSVYWEMLYLEYDLELTGWIERKIHRGCAGAPLLGGYQTIEEKKAAEVMEGKVLIEIDDWVAQKIGEAMFTFGPEAHSPGSMPNLTSYAAFGETIGVPDVPGGPLRMIPKLVEQLVQGLRAQEDNVCIHPNSECAYDGRSGCHIPDVAGHAWGTGEGFVTPAFAVSRWPIRRIRNYLKRNIRRAMVETEKVTVLQGLFLLDRVEAAVPMLMGLTEDRRWPMVLLIREAAHMRVGETSEYASSTDSE